MSTVTDPKNVILSSREDAQTVLDRMKEILARYDNVTLEDLLDLTGLPTTHKDHSLGWKSLETIEIKQVEKGFVLDLPPVEEL